MAWQNWFKNVNNAPAAGRGKRGQKSNAGARAAAPSAWLLEPRMLFDGAVAATVTTTLSNSDSAVAKTADDHADSAKTSASSDTRQSDATQDAGAEQQSHNSDVSQNSDPNASSDAVAIAATATPARLEVAFVDTSVDGYQSLIDGIKPGVEVVLIDGSSNGLQQIADWASTHSGYDAVHIFSHGVDGQINLGSFVLTDSAIHTADVQAALTTLGQALTADGDLLLYGCDVAAGTTGDAFIRDLATATGADVAASSDATGSSLLGGNWTLEKHSGEIETTALAVEGYQGLLTQVRLIDSDIVPASASDPWLATKNIGGYTFTFSAPQTGGFLSIDQVGGLQGLYAYDYNSVSGNGTVLTIKAPDGYTFDLSAFNLASETNLVDVEVTYANGSTGVMRLSGTAGRPTLWDYMEGAFDDITQAVFTSSEMTVLQNFDIIDIKPIGGVAQNTAPAIGNLNGDSLTYTEDSPAITLDVGGDATVTDSDSANFDGGKLTVSITANGTASEDVLSIRNDGTGSGQIGFNGVGVTWGGTVIGMVTGGTAGNDLVVSLNSSATPEAVQALTRALTYSNSNMREPSTETRSISITVSDGDGHTSTPATVEVAVIGHNDAPKNPGIGNYEIITERGSEALLFTGVDIDTVEAGQLITEMAIGSVSNVYGDSESGVNTDTGNDGIYGAGDILHIDGSAIPLVEASGTTQNNGFSWSVTQSADGSYTLTLSKAEGVSPELASAILNEATYSYIGSDSTITYRAFSASLLKDNGGTANGGKDSDSASMIGLFDMALAPLAANSAPVIANLDGDSITYTEGQDAVALDAGADATITDGDSANFDGGALTVSITANGHGSEDVLTIRTGGEPGKQITAYGSIVNYSGLDIGFYTGGSNGNDLVVTLNSNATPEAVQALVRAIAYQNSNDLNPSTDIRTVTVSVSDGDGGTSNLATLQINVTDVNDAPLVYGSGHYQIYQQRGSELTLFDSVTIDPVEAGQTITELQLTIWNYWNDGNMNDALTIDGSVIPLTAGSGTTAISGLSWTISGGSSISILTLSKAQGLSGAAASALVSAITYSNTGSDAQYGFRQFELSSVKDSGGTANGGSDTMNWTGVSTWFDIMLDATVNSAPAIGGLDGDSVTYAEGAAPVVLDANGDATVTDGDSADFDGGSLTAAVTANGHSSEDVLSIRSGGEAGNVIGVSGSSVTYNGVEIGTVSGGSDGNDLVVAFNANATPEAVQALTRALTYQNSNDSDPSTDTRSISITVSDGDGGTSNTATLQVSVTGVNDAPVVAGSGGSYGYSERDSALTLFNGINIDPVEAGQAITDFVIRIWSYSSSANSSEVLHIDGSDLPLTNGSGVTADHGFRWSVSQTGGQSYLSLTKAEGISAEAATALVAGITYRNNNTESTGMREILFAAVWDNGGTDNGGVDYTSANITTWVNLAIQPEQNSAPTIGGLDGDSVTYTEGAAPVLLDAGSDATVTDGDSANLDGGSLTVSITANGHGSEDVLSIRTGGEAGSVIGVNGSSVSYNGVEIGTVSGGSEGHDLVVAFNANATPEAVQALTRALTYQNSNNSDPSTDTRSISITVSDGDDGTSSTATLQVEVNGVNDAPLISLNNSLTWLNAGTPQAQLFSQVTIDPVEAGQTITQLTLTADLLIDGNHEVLSVDGTTITLGQSASGTTALNGLSWSLIVSGSSASLVLSSAGGISGAAASTLVEGIRYSNTSNTTSGDVNSGTLRQFTLIGVKDSGGTANGGIDTQNVWMNSLVIVQQGTPVAAPQVTSVTASSPDGYYKSGQTVVITVNYSAELTLDTTDGRPTLQLDVGGATRYATYSGQSAANQLQFEYLVQAGDNSADLEVSGNAALQLNGATLQNAAGTAADLTLPEAGAQNSLSGQSAIVVDTVLPGATISISNPLLGMGQYATVTITFTEAVTDLTRDDISVENGTLGTLFTSDGGVTWQASLEPTTGITAAGNQIILNNAGVSDRAGNAGEGSTSISYDIDGVRPTVGITLGNDTLKAGASTVVTVTFSEAVSGFSRTNLNPTSGTLSEFSSADGGITWTGTLTAESDNDGSGNVIFMDNTGIQDRAGNTLQGLTLSAAYTIDTQLPTGTVALSDAALIAGESTVVTVTFTEAVTGLSREAFTVGQVLIRRTPMLLTPPI
ncbi:Ig-like domain-containing protein [Erwinia sp. Leaf53]|uniref:Ig-like domain-containing protein n=1 Tax=Erwinia sp. Leaf53 TaxID=1736225 RepID=UPI0006F38280|nr:Ig-like domain-containing protein [Erwinia sp. Leaf53]KQN63471.1 hypothetical protein ASF13_17905 [Erwinia sp. Leaf53]